MNYEAVHLVVDVKFQSDSMSTYYSVTKGYTITSDDLHCGGGVWIEKNGHRAFIPADNIAALEGPTGGGWRKNRTRSWIC